MTKAQQRRAARERAEARQAETRRAARVRRQRLWALTSLVAVVAVVAVLVVVKFAAGPSASASDTNVPTGAARDRILSQVTGVPADTLDAVGIGSAAGLPKQIKHATPLTSDGKPELLYVGAEWCPFCAAERWAMVVALDRFGTFSNLGLTRSAGDDTFPNTATLSFHGSSYTSQYLVFTPVETQDADHQPLQAPTAEQQKVMTTYDAPPYVDKSSTGAIPFVDFGNQYLVSGSSFSPQVLADRSWSQIAASLDDPSDPVAKAVDGAANTLTAAICAMTDNQPAEVCTSKAVAPLATKL